MNANDAFPIFPDRTVGPADYRKLELDRNEMWVTNVFYTIQGEGPFAGHPAVFVRFAGCNRGGKGTGMGAGCLFCDTDFRFDNGRRMNIFLLLAEADRLYSETAISRHYEFVDESGSLQTEEPAKLMVITGGEPMLQPNIDLFIDTALEQGWDVQMESNGDLMRAALMSNTHWTYVVSPKINPDGRYPDIRPDVLDRMDYMKVLVSADQSDPYHLLPDYVNKIARDQLYISPITVYRRPPPGVAKLDDVDMPATQRNMAYASDLALRMGCRLNLQTHVFLGIE